MRIGWLADDPGYLGGAELTQREFRDSAPEGIEIVDCPPGEIVPDLDRYVIHNNLSYSAVELTETVIAPTWRYHHDFRAGTPIEAEHIYCSPVQRERSDAYDNTSPLIPPAIDLARFKPPRQHRRNGKRQGTCCIATFQNPGKGAQLLEEWAEENGEVDVWGFGPFMPQGQNINQMGPSSYEKVPEILWAYERFVYLPSVAEPFGRAVVEAHAAECEVITNRNAGAVWWLEERPEALQTAAQDFWSTVLG
jgi:hypothetical protein